jgi:hypothetical protein
MNDDPSYGVDGLSERLRRARQGRRDEGRPREWEAEPGAGAEDELFAYLWGEFGWGEFGVAPSAMVLAAARDAAEVTAREAAEASAREAAESAREAAEASAREVAVTEDESACSAVAMPAVSLDAAAARPLSVLRIADTLQSLDIRYLTDADGSLLALWERHAVLFAAEGVAAEILVSRVRPHATVPPAWGPQAYQVVNEWNQTRRFCKAYVGDPTDRGQLPVYAEMQIPLLAGVHDELLVELIDCAAAVAMGFVDWLHGEGALL